MECKIKNSSFLNSNSTDGLISIVNAFGLNINIETSTFIKIKSYKNGGIINTLSYNIAEQILLLIDSSEYFLKISSMTILNSTFIDFIMQEDIDPFCTCDCIGSPT